MKQLAIEIEEKGSLLYTRTIVAAALGSVGSKQYQQLFIERDDGVEEVIYNGEFACAYQSSVPYKVFDLLAAAHTTVNGFEIEMLESEDWLEIGYALPGAVGILEPKRHLDGQSGTRHTFICVSHEDCVHNEADPKIRTPQHVRISNFKHHTGEERSVERFFVHRKILQEQEH